MFSTPHIERIYSKSCGTWGQNLTRHFAISGGFPATIPTKNWLDNNQEVRHQPFWKPYRLLGLWKLNPRVSWFVINKYTLSPWCSRQQRSKLEFLLEKKFWNLTYSWRNVPLCFTLSATSQSSNLYLVWILHQLVSKIADGYQKHNRPKARSEGKLRPLACCNVSLFDPSHGFVEVNLHKPVQQTQL